MSHLIVKYKKQKFNLGKYSYIKLNKGYKALVDTKNFDELSRYSWKVQRSSHCLYAVTDIFFNGKMHRTKMHRMVTNCPRGQVTHHINHNTLDNREENLLNCTQEKHLEIHNDVPVSKQGA